MKKVARFIFAWALSPLMPAFFIMSIPIDWLLDDDYSIKDELDFNHKYSLASNLRAWFKWASLRG